MATPAQIAANRKNAQNSTGPKSKPGKDKTRFNGLKHGLRSNQVVLPGENVAEFQAELKGWRDDWQPKSHTAAVLVERAAVASWRLRRCVRAESDLLMTTALRAAKKRRRGTAVADDPERRADRAEERMYRKPAESLAELRSFIEGVDRLIARWGELDDVLAEDAQEWHDEGYHDTLLNLLGLDSEVDAAGAGPMAADSRRLLASNNAQLLADQLPVDEADAIGARLRAGIAREVEALEDLARELAEPDDEADEPDEVDGTPDEEIKFLGVNRQIMLLHRYEMANERSMRAAMRDLVVLEKSGSGLAGRGEEKAERHTAKTVTRDAPAATTEANPHESRAPTEPNSPGRPSTSRRVKPERDGGVGAVEPAVGAVSPRPDR